MMFWAMNLKAFPCLPGGVSLFGYPTSHRCPQSQMQHRQTARRMIWFYAKAFTERKETGKHSFLSLHCCLGPLQVLRTQTRELLIHVPPPTQPTWSKGRSEVTSIPTSWLLTPTSSRSGPKCVFKEDTASPRGGAISSSCPTIFVMAGLVLKMQRSLCPCPATTAVYPALAGPRGTT